MQRLVDEHIAGKIDHNYRLWLLINLEVWYRLKVEGVGLEAVGEEIERLSGGQHQGGTAPSEERPIEVAASVL